METADVLIVGSGITGAMAAQTLVEGGATTTMLDVGSTDSRYASLIPPSDFISIRESDQEQYRYFLGDDFEGIPSGMVSTGAQLTPPRRHVFDDVDRLLPLASASFVPQESLAYGGLGNAWGAGCCVYSDPELTAAGLDAARMRVAYQAVADRIGISGADDDARPYTWAGLDGIQRPPDMDETCTRLFERYRRKRENLRATGIHMGRSAMALITQDQEDRRGHTGRDMDFYSDAEKSVYRPWITVDALRGDPRFTYSDGMLALRFEEGADGVEVECLDTRSSARVRHRGRRLILATGPLGTARIALRSLGGSTRALPILTNPYTYVPGVQPSLTGAGQRRRRMSLAQLSLFHDPDGTNTDVAMGSIYSYRSLMLFRILPQAPIDMVDARILMRYLLPAITITGIHHPERPGPNRTLRLIPDVASPTGDRLEAEYRLSDDETRRIAAREKVMIRALRSLGCWTIKRITPAMGASIHYAGTLPFRAADEPYTLREDGRLNGASRVWVADGSGFRFLPAKGLTLSLMANAHLVAQAALR